MGSAAPHAASRGEGYLQLVRQTRHYGVQDISDTRHADGTYRRAVQEHNPEIQYGYAGYIRPAGFFSRDVAGEPADKADPYVHVLTNPGKEWLCLLL